MRNRLVGSIFATMAVFFFSTLVFAQTDKQSKETRAKPSPRDLSGVWDVARTKDRGRFSKVEPSMLPEALEKYNAIREGSGDPNERAENTDPLFKCAPPSPSRLMTTPHPFEIIQIPGRVLMIFERDRWIRTIWMDEEHPKDLYQTWMGHSVGKWDGDTLVVDTISLKDLTWIDDLGHPHSDDLHMVERIRRLDHDTLVADFRFDDPKMYTKPWGDIQKVYKLKDWRIAEYLVCEDEVLKRLNALPSWYVDTRPSPDAP